MYSGDIEDPYVHLCGNDTFNMTEIQFTSPQLWTLIYILELPACGILKYNRPSPVRPTPPPEIVIGVAEAA